MCMLSSERSAFYNVGSLHSASAFGQIVGYSLAFVQSLEAFALNCGKVYENVVSVFSGDEAIAFLSIKPFLQFPCSLCVTSIENK